MPLLSMGYIILFKVLFRIVERYLKCSMSAAMVTCLLKGHELMDNGCLS